MARHDYQLEPNATFTPDMKWIIFRSNMFEKSYVLTVEVAKARESKEALSRNHVAEVVTPEKAANPLCYRRWVYQFLPIVTALILE